MSADRAQPRSIPTGPAVIFGSLVLLGVVVFGWTASQDPAHAHRVFLHNWLLWAAIAQGALVFSNCSNPCFPSRLPRGNQRHRSCRLRGRFA